MIYKISPNPSFPKRGIHRKARRTIFLILFFMLAGVAFTEEVTKARKVFKAVVGSDGAQRVEITAGEYFFDPDYIIVKVNVPVAIKIKKKEGITPHDIVINAPEAGINIKESLSTEPKVIIFTPIKTGKYPFYCSKKLLFFKSHRSRGMEGVLDVIE